MAKVGYIMVPAVYDNLEEDKKWMEDFGCVRIFEEQDTNEATRPLWKQLMITLERGDTLVIAKFSNAVRGSRELAIFLEFCRVKVIRIVSIHDKIDSQNELFPETTPANVLQMVGSLPYETLVLRKTAAHHVRLKEKMAEPISPTTRAQRFSSKALRLEREKTVVNMYVSGHSIDDILKAGGYTSRSSIFRILNKHGITLNRGHHSGPIKKKE